MLGSALILGVIVSIPLFANGILQRTLTGDLMQHQRDTGVFPGYINLSFQLSKDEEKKAQQASLLSEYAEIIPARLDIPLRNTVHSVNFTSLHIERDNILGGMYLCRFVFQSELEDHIEVLLGRMFDREYDPAAEEIEVMITEEMMHTQKLVPDGVYTISNGSFMSYAAVKVRVVGVFRPLSEDEYWQSMSHNESFFLPYETLERYNGHPFTENTRLLYTLIFDYREIKIEQVDHIVEEYFHIQNFIDRHFDAFTQTPISSTFVSVIEKFANRAENLRFLLQLLNIPILFMLFYYIFMIAKLKLSDEESFIAVIRSRGASGIQIFLIYLFEAMFIGIAAIFIGLPLGWAICSVIGSSNGFLDFISRAAIPLRMTEQVYVYTVIAFVSIVVTTVVPALAYSRSSIVEQKRNSVRQKKPLWKVLYLDVILLGLSLYYLFMLREQTEFIQAFGLGGTDGMMYIPLYFASTVFTIGLGLCFLRLYPWLVTIIYIIGRRFWSPVTYAAFHAVKRSGTSENFVILFIIIVLSVGLFNAGAARTINQNLEDRIKSSMGSDIVTRQHWTQLDERGNFYISENAARRLSIAPSTGPVIYVEPSFLDFQMLDGVDAVARVLRQDDAEVRGSGGRRATTFMAFDPYEFANTSWWRSDLAPYSFNEYMNVMMDYPGAVILSESLRGVAREGDMIRVENLNRNRQIRLHVVAFADYWPSISPFIQDEDGNLTDNHFIVANLEFVFSRVPPSPYDVWIKKSQGISDAHIYEQLENIKAPFQRIDTVTDLLVASKNDPMIQGTNGAMSLGFIIAMITCSMGFLVYWILSINSRMLQFGIKRAMGMTRGKIFRMLIFEQFLVSGTAFFAGMIIGNLAVMLYVPIFSLLYSGNDLNIPFRIFLSNDDPAKIYIIFGLSIIFCLLILIQMLRRIDITKVIKFGED